MLEYIYLDNYIQKMLQEHGLNRLKELREAARLTQRQLANKAGVDQALIAMLEVDKRKARLGNLSKLATALGVGVTELKDLQDDGAHERGKRAAKSTAVTKAKRSQAAALKWWLYLEPKVALSQEYHQGVEFVDKASLAYVVSAIGPDLGYMTYYGTREEARLRAQKFATAWANGRVDYHRRAQDRGIILDGSPIRCLVGGGEGMEGQESGQTKKQGKAQVTTGKLGPASCSECGRPALEGTFLCAEHAQLL